MAGRASKLAQLLLQFGREGVVGATGRVGPGQAVGQGRHYLRLLGVAAAQHAHAQVGPHAGALGGGEGQVGPLLDKQGGFVAVE